MLIDNPPVEITENLMMFGLKEYPLFLVRGKDEAVLFEGGVGSVGPMFRDQLEQAGIDAGMIKQIILPHAHPDHVMAVPFLRTLCPEATVAASQAAAAMLSVEKAIAFFCKLDDAVSNWLIERGVATEEQRRPAFEPLQIAVDRKLTEGDAVTVDGSSFQVIQTAGHSDCGLAFHETGQRILIISDAAPYYVPGTPNWWPCYFTGYAPFVESMQRLSGLDAEILCLGHQAAIRGADEIKTFFADAIAATEAYHNRIVEERQSGKSVREIAEQLGSEMHAVMPSLPLDFFQKNCGLLAKQSLRHAGVGEE